MASLSLVPYRRIAKVLASLSLALLVALLLGTALNLVAPIPVEAKTITIRDGGPYPCTDAGIHAALNDAQPLDRILVICVKIQISHTIVISKDISVVGYPEGTVITMGLSLTPLILEGGGNTGMFSITSGVHVTLSTMIISHSVSLGAGGAIYNQGRLVLNDISLINNSSAGAGGAIFNEGELIMGCQQRRRAPRQFTEFLCMLSNNHSDQSGGAIHGDGVMSIFGFTFLDNTAAGGGGAILQPLPGALLGPDSTQGFEPSAASVASATIASSTFISNSAFQGGAVSNAGALVIADSEFMSNTASSDGGALLNQATLNVSGSTFDHNVSGYRGAGLNNGTTGHASVSNSAFISNTAFIAGGLANQNVLTVSLSVFVENLGTYQAGGIENDVGRLSVASSLFISNTGPDGGGINNFNAVLNVDSSTFSGNSAVIGGGISSYGTSTMTLSNSTLNGNVSTASSGGGIASSAVAVITNSTIVSNTAVGSGGDVARVTGAMYIHNSIVAFGVPSNCAGVITSTGHNLDGANACGFHAAGDISNTNPLLGPLQNNGGPLLPGGQSLWTHALLPGSAAIDHGDNIGCPATDERGAARPFNAICDIGAFESGALVPQSITFPPVADKALGESPVTPGATASSGLPVTYTASGQCVAGGGGTQLTLLAIGGCTAVAHRAGNGTYLAAPDMTQTFNIVYKLFLPLIQR